MNLPHWLFLLGTLCTLVAPAGAGERSLDGRLHHLRAAGPPEWSDFSDEPEAPNLSVHFQAEANAGEATLRLRQQDVKQDWHVTLNGKELGRLRQDENDMVVYLPVPGGQIAHGENTLTVEQIRNSIDDIRVGQIALDERPTRQVLSQATLELAVFDAEKNVALPSRITILDAAGALATTGAQSGGGLAVRPGVVYTATGHAVVPLAAGEYTVYAGRGFEYGIDSFHVTLRAGERVSKRLGIRREVPTWA